MALFVNLHDCKLQVGSALAAIEHEAFGVGWASANGLAAISTLRLIQERPLRDGVAFRLPETAGLLDADNSAEFFDGSSALL